MYRTAIEGILGIQVLGAVLRISPCIPRTWPGFEIHYRYGSSGYRIAVENPQGVNLRIAQATMDGQTISGRPCDIALLDDGLEHQVHITLG
jgi:cyclic beta-1,2-glucan synthetase